MANSFLPPEARLLLLLSMFELLTVQMPVRKFSSPVANQVKLLVTECYSDPLTYFAQPLLSKVQVSLLNIRKSFDTPLTHIISDKFVDVDTMVLMTNMTTSVRDYVNTFPGFLRSLETVRKPGFLTIATDGSVINEKAAEAIYVLQLEYSFSVCLSITPIFQAKMIAMIFAPHEIPASFAKVNFLTPVPCNSLEKGGVSKCFKEFCSLTLPHIVKIRLAWIPSHRGVMENKAADSSARLPPQISVTDVIPSIT